MYRLLSQPGIPKLRALARSGQISKKLHFKGKGHEFSDAARLLNYYQLWLDNLYPRAKFADGLQIIEKVGHSKRMQMTRKEWIDEGKPEYAREKALKKSREEEDNDMYGGGGDVQPAESGTNEGLFRNVDSRTAGDAGTGSHMFFPDHIGQAAQEEDIAPSDDELDALLAEQNMRSRTPEENPASESEGEDDLDALLAEHETRRENATAKAQDEDENEDDLEALLAEQTSRTQPRPRKQRNSLFDDDEEGEDDRDAAALSLAERETPQLPDLPISDTPLEHRRKETLQQDPMSLPPNEDTMLSSSPIPNEEQVAAEEQNSAGRDEPDEGDLLSSSPIPNDEGI